MPYHILITGGAGFIGSFLTDYFISNGHSVRILDNLDPQVHPQGAPTYLNSQAEFLQADIRNKQAVSSALEGIDVVIHAAAAVGVGQSMYRVQHYVDTNAGGTAVLLECLIERKQVLKKLIVFTSMTGYGEGVYRRPSDGSLLRVEIRTPEDIARFGWDLADPITGETLEVAPTPEHSALLARNVYALAKRWQEDLALSLGDVYNIPTTCLRLFNVFGPRQSLSNPYTGVLAIFLSRLLNGERPVVYEDGRQSRDFVSVHDVVRAVDLAIQNPATNGQVFNIGTGIARGVGEIAQTLARLIGREDIEPNITGQFRKGDIRHCVADLSRSRAILGFEPQTHWEAALQEIIEWSATADKVDNFQQVDQELRKHGLVS